MANGRLKRDLPLEIGERSEFGGRRASAERAKCIEHWSIYVRAECGGRWANSERTKSVEHSASCVSA